MFSRKPSPLPPAPSRHSFRMKALGTEFEAHGLGLIVAAMAVFLVLTAIVIGSAAMSKPVSGILDGNAQAEPITPVRPPP